MLPPEAQLPQSWTMKESAPDMRPGVDGKPTAMYPCPSVVPLNPNSTWRVVLPLPAAGSSVHMAVKEAPKRPEMEAQEAKLVAPLASVSWHL